MPWSRGWPPCPLAIYAALLQQLEGTPAAQSGGGSHPEEEGHRPQPSAGMLPSMPRAQKAPVPQQALLIGACATAMLQLKYIAHNIAMDSVTPLTRTACDEASGFVMEQLLLPGSPHAHPRQSNEKSPLLTPRADALMTTAYWDED